MERPEENSNLHKLKFGEQFFRYDYICDYRMKEMKSSNIKTEMQTLKGFILKSVLTIQTYPPKPHQRYQTYVYKHETVYLLIKHFILEYILID